MLDFLFGKKRNNAVTEHLIKELSALEARWNSFLVKLEGKYDEVLAAIEQEGTAVYQQDTDEFKRAFIRFKSGMDGQLSNICDKASETCDKEIRDTFYELDKGPLHPTHGVLYEWRNRCLETYSNWENRITAKQKKAWIKVEQLDDPELKYQAILLEYEQIKDKFNCKQCGGSLTLEKIFFISTYVTCPHCQTQNTFEPSRQARMLEHIARDLAERRTAHLLDAYEKEKELERELYMQGHELKLSLIHESNKKIIAEKEAKRLEIEKLRQEAIKNAPSTYRRYLRAMFDEWNLLVPELKEQNEKVYQSRLKDFNTIN